MGVVCHVVVVAFAHLVRIQQIARGKQNAGNGKNGEKQNGFKRIEKNECEQHGRNSARCANGIVIVVVFVFDQAPDVGSQDAPK